jgi:3-oxoacyl-[acyl-carrier-protein] synthase-3
VPLYAHVTGWGKYVPEAVLTNDDLATFLDTSDEWIRQHTGIRERRIATGDETVATMSAKAARAALAVAGLTAQDLDLIIMSTSSPDRQLPGAAQTAPGSAGAAAAAWAA